MITYTTITAGFKEFGRIVPTGGITWADLGSSPYGSWANWTNFNPSPNNIQIEILVDSEVIANRSPNLTYTGEGEVTVSLEYGSEVDSNLNILSGTTINFVQGTTYSVPQARYYLWTVTVTTDSNLTLPTLTFPDAGFTTALLDDIQSDVDTSTLTGTIDAREIDTDIGVAIDFIATAHQEGVTYSSGQLQDRVYAVPDDYIFQENAVIVNIVSKTPPTIRCFDLNGESIDAVIDLQITGLPEIQLTDDGVVS